MTHTTVAAEAAAKQRGIAGSLWRSIANIRILLFLTVVLIVTFGISQPIFLTPANLVNAVSSVAVLWFIAIGASFVVITGGIDLSSGAVAAAAGILFSQLLLAMGMVSWLALLVSIVFGAALAALTNGVLIGYLGLNVFVVTLATMISFTGAVSLWSGTQSFYVSDPLLSWISIGTIGGFPVVIMLMLLLLFIFLIIQRRSYFGRAVYAVGGGPLAARLSGIHTRRVTMIVYGLAGGTAAIAGLIAVGRIGAATPVVDNTLPLQAIAAILLGGSALSGGTGGVGGTALGVIFMGLLQNGLSISGVPSFWQQVLTGVVLIIAIVGDRLKTIRLRRPRVVVLAQEPPLGTVHDHGEFSGSEHHGFEQNTGEYYEERVAISANSAQQGAA